VSEPLDCKAVSRLISDGLDKTLAPADRAQLRLHFVVCQTCRDVDAQMAFLRRAMQTLGKVDKTGG
jgi:predicted anti-sigma-YlaC factor YlaD